MGGRLDEFLMMMMMMIVYVILHEFYLWFL